MTKQFYIQCGNWCLKLHIDPKLYSTLTELYTELSTNAIEIIFGSKEFSNQDDDYYALMDENGVNCLDSNDTVIPSFTTKIHILSSKKNNPHKLLTSLRTADIFANAAQWENVKYAIQAEEIERNDSK
jgi:glutathione peroxidase-family protein